MTKRLYYDDPLAAAWMAQHFNIILGYYQRHIQYPFVIIQDTSVKGLLISDAFGKYYIHPDSLHIFEPQIGDEVVKIEEAIRMGYTLGRIIQRNGIPFLWPKEEV